LRITVNINKPFPEFVPKANPDYVFGDIELLKDVLMMIEMRIPVSMGSRRNRQEYATNSALRSTKPPYHPCAAHRVH
jgi:hypothetical protein